MAGQPQPGRRAPKALTHEVSKRLLEFLCALAWADHAIQLQERAYFQRLIDRFGLGGSEVQALVKGLRTPPSPQALDISSIPPEHRRLFLAEAQRIANADGRLAPRERVVLDRLRNAILRAR